MNTDEQISELDNMWINGAVFTTTFWGVTEVCIILSKKDGYTYFCRLESIRWLSTVKKDYCAVELEDNVFSRIHKTFLHHSEWYYEYKEKNSLRISTIH